MFLLTKLVIKDRKQLDKNGKDMKILYKQLVIKATIQQLCAFPLSHLVCLPSWVVMTCLLPSVLLECSFLLCVFVSHSLSVFVGLAVLSNRSVEDPVFTRVCLLRDETHLCTPAGLAVVMHWQVVVYGHVT